MLSPETVSDPRAADAVDAEIGAAMRAARLSSGLSQERLGQAVGVTFQQVQKYENGRNRVSASRLLAIARLLGVAPASLLPDGGADAAPLETPLVAFLATREVRLLLAALARVGPERRGNALRLVAAVAGLLDQVPAEEAE